MYNQPCRVRARDRELVAAARRGLRAHFGRCAEVVARAPGRLEVLGGHTDYNEGLVTAIAIERATVVAGARRSDRMVRAWTDHGNVLAQFDLRRLDEGGRGSWDDYLAGVAAELLAAGCELPGADLAIASDVPVGGGVSSSAALEVAVALALTELAGCALEPEALALLCQRAENDFVGMRCGILDQFTSVFAREAQVLCLDCRSRERRLVPMADERVRFVVCDTRKPRDLIDSAYNQRRAECERAAALLGVRALRDIDSATLAERADRLDETLLRRARHVVSENERVLAGIEALEAGDWAALGALINAAHLSLRDDYEVSCAELEALRAAALDAPGCLGARLVGAGFGGCVLALVEADQVDAFAARVAGRYRRATGLQPGIFATRAADGAGIVAPDEE